MTEFIIRNANINDIKQIQHIYAQSVLLETASWEYTPPDIAEMQTRFNAIKAKNYPYIIASIGNKIVGYAYVNTFRPREAYRFCVENSIYIDPIYQGRGIAKALMKKLIELCSAQGIKYIIAVIGDSENLASIALHNSCGFEHIGVFPKIGFKFDKWLDSILMQLTIADMNG